MNLYEVFVPVSNLGEALMAIVAFEWSLPRVFSDVVLNVARFTENFVAALEETREFALVLSGPLVYNTLVQVMLIL